MSASSHEGHGPTAVFAHDAEAAVAELAALFARYRAEGRNDAAYCVAHAGVRLVGDRTPQEILDFSTRFRPTRPRRAGRPLDDASWLHHLYHPDDDPYVGKVFESVLAPLRRVRSQSVQKFGHSTRDALSPASSSIALVRAMGAAAFTLNVPTPLIFLRPDRAGAITLLPSEPIASVAGGAVVTGRSVEELAFFAGHHMAGYRPDHYIRALYAQTPELTTIFLAVLKIGRRELQVPPVVEQFVEKLEMLVGDDVSCAALVRKVARLFLARADAVRGPSPSTAVQHDPYRGLAERGEIVNIARWIAGTERTALRAGLLLAGDLDVARKLLPSIAHAPADAMADLTAWSMTEDYFALRQHTGIAIWPDDASVRAEAAPPPSEPPRATMPPPAILASMNPAAMGDLHSIEVSLDELEAHPPVTSQRAPSDETPSALRSVDIPAGELEGGRDTDTVRVGAILASQYPLAESYSHHLAAGALERAYYVAAVWVRREGELTPPPIRELFDAQRARPSLPPTNSLDEHDWLDALADPGERTLVGQLLTVLVAPMLAAQPRTPEDYGYERARALDYHDPTARALALAAATLGVRPPLAFADDQYPGALGRPPCEPPIALFDPARWRDVDALERGFIAAEHVAYLRTERRARVLVRSPSLLAQLVRAVVQAFALGEAPDVDAPLVVATLRALGDDADALIAARALTLHLAGDPTLDEQVIAWCEATERTAARAGLLVAFDFDAASRAMRRQRGAPAIVPADTKLAALEDFAAGEDFALLRLKLGLAT